MASQIKQKQSKERKTDWTSSKFKTVGASKDTNQEREKTTHVMGENICKANMWEENIIQNIYTTFTTQQ